jgi:predicted aspartyl protease
MMLGLIDTGATTMGLVNSVAATAGFTAALVSQIISGSGDLRTEFSYFV